MRANVVTGEVTDYEWNDSDRLIRVNTSIGGAPTSRLAESNRYDSSGIRKRKLDRSGNSSLEYTADIITAASKAGTSSSQTPTISYVMGHQILGAEVNGNFQFFLTDALGTVRDIVDDSGDVVQSYEFDEHGIPMPGSGAASGTFSPKTYQGALSVNDDRNDSGLYLMGHRHYAPELGRFISRDPIGFQGGLNLFNGAGTSPVTFTDAFGLNPALSNTVRVVLPLAVSQYLSPTIRQSKLLDDGVGGTVRYTEDGKLVILISGADSLNTADKINILANECAHYIDLQLKGKPKSLTFEEAMASEGFSDLLETLVGTIIPPSNPGLRAKQQRVRNTVRDLVDTGDPRYILEHLNIEAAIEHGMNPFSKKRPSSPIKIGLPKDCR